MNSLLHMILMDKQVEIYNVLVLLEDIKIMLRNQHFFIDKLVEKLVHVKGHLQCDFDPPSSSAKDPNPIYSSDS